MDNIQEGEIVNQPLTPTLTPMPKVQGKAMTMDFPDAMRQVIAEKKVARIEWGNYDYGFLKDEWLTIFTKNTFHTWLISAGDMEGQDWIIVKELDEAN